MFLSFFSVNAQTEHFEFKRLYQLDSTQLVPSALPYSSSLLRQLEHEKEVKIKSITREWIYIQAPLFWLKSAKDAQLFSSFHWEFTKAMPLNDSTRLKHNVNEVHEGIFPLPQGFTGKDVIVGFVDTGFDYNHPDFQHPDGSTRVLYYWDQGMTGTADRIPQPYNYGQLFTREDILNGTCLAIEEAPNAHGSTVAGVAVSDGSATGREKGMAPDADVIVFETDFTLPNWTLTVADACDFLFKVADSLGRPAVMNLSVGSYLGSHDGNDPAAELMEDLLANARGKAIVCAAGNSGSWGKYHLKTSVDSDTNFVWLKPNKAHEFGFNAAYFDLWTDSINSNWSYALGLVDTLTYQTVSELDFRPTLTGVGTVVYDTLWATNQTPLAFIECYPEWAYGNFHLEVLVKNIDTNGYFLSFKTTGDGSYDLWSGSSKIGLTDMVSSVPSIATFPDIVFYSFPDSLSTVVSSWACSSSMITTGNLRNRYGHYDGNGDYFVPTYNVPVGGLTIHSSKGPTRHGLIKPDITACGDMSLSTAPLWLVQDPVNYPVCSDDLMHARNGGTSMASPVIAGIVALYLEKCNQATVSMIKTDLFQSAITDGMTGTVPNNAYGYGKVNAFSFLNQTNYTANAIAPPIYCSGDSVYVVSTHLLQVANWSTSVSGVVAPLTTLEDTVAIFATVRDQNGCLAKTDTVISLRGDIPPVPVIHLQGNHLTVDDYSSIYWLKNGVILSGEISPLLVIDTTVSALYQVQYVGANGCVQLSLPFDPTLPIATTTLQFFPNPVYDQLSLLTTKNCTELLLFDEAGKLVETFAPGNLVLSVDHLSAGNYQLWVKTDQWELVRFVKTSF